MNIFKEALIPLDKVYTKKQAIILIVDAKISLFLLLNAWRPGNGYLLWQSFLNSLAYQYSPDGLIIVDDQRDENFQYWRHAYLRQRGYPEYKGNRQCTTAKDARPEGYHELNQALLDYISKNNIDYFVKPGVEADDWAGLAARVNYFEATNKTLFLVSFDGDWQQLVSDEHSVLIYNTGIFKKHSTLMDEAEVLYYHANKNITLTIPADIIEYKMEQGDVGDNLLPNSPQAVIDLINPREDVFNNKDYEDIRAAILNPKFIPSQPQAIEAEIKLIN